MKTDLLYSRSGGFAGIDEEVLISMTGVIRITGRFLGNTTRTITSSEADQLIHLLQDWSTLDVDHQPPMCADAFSYSITYDGRTLSWDDCTPNKPFQLPELSKFISAL